MKLCPLTKKMAGDLKRFLYEEKQSLRRFQSNLDDIIKKYNRPFNDNAVDIHTCSVIKGKEFLRSKDPSYFGHSKFTHTKKKEQSLQDSQRSFRDVDSVSPSYDGSDRHTSGYHTLKSDDESCVSGYPSLNLTYTKEKRHPIDTETSLHLPGKTISHCSPSDTFSLAEQNADVEDTEELLALKETMLSFAVDYDEPSDAETITSSSTCGSEEYEEGFEYLSDSEEEITKDRPSTTSSTSSQTYSLYNRKNSAEMIGDEIDGEMRLEKWHLFDANTTSQNNKNLYSRRYRNLQDETNFTSPFINNQSYKKRVDAKSPCRHTNHEYRPCDVSKDSLQTHDSSALDSFVESYWTRQQIGNVYVKSTTNREVSNLASTEKQRNGDIHNTHCKVNNSQNLSNDQILNGESRFHRRGVKEHRANVNRRKSSSELGEKEKVAQVFNRMACGQGMQRDLHHRPYIMKETRQNSLYDTTGTRQMSDPHTTGTRQMSVPDTTGIRQVSDPHTTGTRQMPVPDTTGTRQVLDPHSTGSRQVPRPHTTGTRQISVPDTTGTRQMSDPHTMGTRQMSVPGATDIRQVSDPHTTGSRQVSRPHTTGTRQISVPDTTGTRQMSDPHTTGTRQMSIPDTTGTRRVSDPHITGTRQMSMPDTTGIRQVSDPHTTGSRQVSRPHTTGTRQMSGPHTTGTRQKSMPNTTGIKQVSDPHTTGTRKVSGNGMTSPNHNSDKLWHSPEQNRYVDQNSEEPQGKTLNKYNSMQRNFIEMSVPPKLVCDQNHLSNGVSVSGFEEPRTEEVSKETQNHYKSMQRKGMYKSAPPQLHCDLKDLSNGISASDFVDEKMPVIEKVYRWLSPTNNDTSVTDRYKIKTKRRLHMAAPHTLDITDNEQVHDLNGGHLTPMGQKKQISWESQVAKPQCYRQDARTNPESPSSIFSRMKLNSPSTASHKPSMVRPSKNTSPIENKSYFRQSLFSKGQDVTEQQNFHAASSPYARTGKDFYSPTRKDFYSPTRKDFYSPTCKDFYSRTRKDFYSPTRLLGRTDDITLNSQRHRSNKSSDTIALQRTRTRSADYFNNIPDFETKENVSGMDNQLTSFVSHQSGAAGCSDQSSHSSSWTTSLVGSAVDSREEKLNMKAFVLSGMKNKNQRSKISATNKIEKEKESYSNAEASFETFVKYSDEYTFKTQESPGVNKRNCLSNSSYVFRAPTRFVSDHQVSENWEQEDSTRSCVMGSPSCRNSPEKALTKREKRFTSPSKFNPIYTSPRHRDHKSGVFSPRKSLVTISSRAKTHSGGKENDSISHLSKLEEQQKEVNIPVRTYQPNEPKETSSKSITPQRSSSITSNDFVSNRFVNLKNRIIVNNQISQNSNRIKKFTQSTPIKRSVVFSMNNTLSTICGKLSDDEDAVDTESDSSDDTVLTIG